mgnify:FL=1
MATKPPFPFVNRRLPSALRVKEGRQPVLPAEQVVVLEALVVLNPGGEIVGLQMAVGPARRVRIAHEGEGGQLLLELPQEVPVGGARNARVPQEVLAQEVEAGDLRPGLGQGVVGPDHEGDIESAMYCSMVI